MLCYLLKNETLPLNFRALHKLILFISIPILFILLQPDLSTALLVGVSAATVVVLSGLRMKHLLLLSFYLILSGIMVWFNLFDYQRERLLDYINSFENVTTANLQVLEAMSTAASGGLTGQGSQYIQHFYSSDFIFATYAGEFGWIGSILLIGVYVVLTLRGLYISSKAQSQFLFILIASLSMTFFFINIINLIMVIHVIPAIGIPLVFVSHSGSSLITWSTGFAIIMSFNNHLNDKKYDGNLATI
jgi:rod shape determining protein RodA